MAVTTTKTNKPLNPRGNDQSPKGYNRAELYTGKALDFDGVNDYVSVADSDDLDGFTNFTLHAIVKADTFPNYCRIFDKNHTSAYNLAVNTSNKLYMYAKNTAFDFDYVVPTGEYVSIVVAFTGGSKVDLFINGQLEETITTSLASISSNGFDLYIGRLYSGAGNPWDGHISNAKIFNVALTAAQVADLYNNPEKIVPTGVADSALKLWLPMMEGAGTTAYDGSGNGNHGTISGATWTHGIGAPVAQTAVIDWNKGTNMLSDSNKFDGVWSKVNGATISSTRVDGPYDEQGWTLNFATNNDSRIQKQVSVMSGTTYVFSIWGRVTSGTKDVRMGAVGQLSTKTFTTTWQRFEVSGSASGTTVYPQLRKDNDEGAYSIEIYGASFEKASSAGPYVPTPVAPQTSDVLLPAGLTTGRDITGVNLFENVRKQGALNLDGNSFAAIHDNTSLDITDAITLECWYYYEATTQAEQLIGKRASSGNWLRLYWPSTGRVRLERNGGAALDKTGLASGNWYHIAATIDESDNAALYINGVEENTATNYSPWGWDIDVPVSIGAWIYNTSYVASSLSYAPNPIAQPRIYNRALTAEEVERNYTAGKYIYTND